MERRRVRDRVHAVEGMGEVDEPALLRGSPRSCPRTRGRAGSPRAGRARSPRPGRRSSPPRRGSRSACGPRASSTASSAPPNALWSVTAIAPSPSASAWSSSSVDARSSSRATTSVCMCRSQTIHGRSASGSASRRAVGRRRAAAYGEPAVELVELARDLAEALLSAPRAPRLPPSRSRTSSSSASRATAAAAELGLLERARRRGDRRSGRCRLEQEAR